MLSMTGFGAESKVFKFQKSSIEVSVEIKTVNSKFLDLSIRSPRGYQVFDSEIGKWVREKLKRGRVDISISRRVVDGKTNEIHLNLEEAAQIYQGLKKVHKNLGFKSDIAFSDLLSIRDWIDTHETQLNEKEEREFLRKVLSGALAKVLKSRKAEGEALDKMIRLHINKFVDIFEKIASRNDEILNVQRERIKERIKQLFGTEGLDSQRLEQEVALSVSRADFREEVDRIRHHLKTFEGIMKGDNEQGRALEFLVQELHREVNTLGSKCAEAKVTPLIIELKTCIERIREQLQNSE